MSKHQEILDYLENLEIGKRVSVRSISNHLRVSDGTAYRAIKEAENRGIVETRPRSGTVRIEKKESRPLDRLTYAEIAHISDSKVVSGHQGLGHEFSKFSIGAMTRENIHRYLVKGGLLIVGDREDIQLIALENHNAILVTGGFEVSNRVLTVSNAHNIPVMVSNYDTFTVATMINNALANLRIKEDLKTVNQVYHSAYDYGYLKDTDTVRDYQQLSKRTGNIRFPVINQHDMVVGVVTMRDVSSKALSVSIDKLMTKNPHLAKPTISLANINQKMMQDDFDMMPVVGEDQKLLGVITRRRVMAELQEMEGTHLHTYSEQILSNLKEDKGNYYFTVEPSMMDAVGSISYGILTEYLKEISIRVLRKKYQKNIIIEQMMLYFLKAVQIEDDLCITPKLMTESRRSAIIDFEIRHGYQLVVKGLVTTKMN
ncbi:CBS-HotDog domain-containing transcription factor SpxR [Streptococcus saliviloxodontae]|uniref:Transcriptional regulator n=1 Tax=Streptococcus saliviloxodontae TaxID=1349416 RepID=A0ABS2PMD5_9STRE|nr:CBS-HotDog domain-containing transcription factor SpxR [Streptococcus saliviloxodontae]MBM7636160.1 putative transcriptional regulator [Streptococcus saliviloxodontae]